MNAPGAYASTTCLDVDGLEATLAAYAEAGVDAVELGYCGDPAVDVGGLVNEYPFDYLAHNYFLPREDEFILNLASADEAIRERSVRYVRDAVEFCDAHGIETYTFHGGFRVDPTLSLEFPTDDVPAYEAAWDRFVDSLRRVVASAEDPDVGLAVENNVLFEDHVVDGEPLLLFCDPGEFTRLFDAVPADEVGVLLDVGHLNVSAHTRGYDRWSVVEEVAPHVEGLHLHWNDGVEDSHGPIGGSSFVSGVLERFGDVPCTLEGRYGGVAELRRELRVAAGRP